LFGSGLFQTLYASQPVLTLMFCTTLEYHVLVTLPLWVLSVTFHHLLPVAVMSLLISLGGCGAAGAQASLPKGRRRWWSRPLVALLFLLQPVVRGWARYGGRLRLRPLTTSERETLDSVSLRDSPERLGEVRYWAEHRVERVGFVNSLLQQLDRQGWLNRSDIGWSEFDVELHGNRWCNLQLATVAEDHPAGRQMIRCRLRARWSLQAKVALWSLLGLELLAIGLFGGWLRWLWLLPLTAAVFAGFLARQKRNFQSVVIVFLDELGKEWKLIKVPSSVSEEPPAPAAAQQKVVVPS
jgi:hypothetical protein